jgi:DNA-binding CsgD family transcriptional regulator
VFFFSMNLLWLYFASKHLHLPKIRIIDNSSALVRLKSIYGLSNRESQIVSSIIAGKSYKEIADQLFISYETVKTHINNIYRKCNIKNKMELAQLLIKCEE